MVTRTKNLNHVRVMQVEETQTFTVHPENPKWYVLSLSPSPPSLRLPRPPESIHVSVFMSVRESVSTGRDFQMSFVVEECTFKFVELKKRTQNGHATQKTQLATEREIFEEDPGSLVLPR